ncbi:hypothetical protein SAMN05421837_107307 [Amycolatopsis pretoriensis]|uniref:Lipoprotein n=1 Tax=Amycolatopsis pretoriensis TaxID=218821 RepID=A0A1H5R7C0_9PSEU|nr:hypothetical protein [Amycolatopsis pretoriensis]SEF34292.1 hypothetical protein SAMN05421837_107307 [Amycolatopsis pretoriensis]
MTKTVRLITRWVAGAVVGGSVGLIVAGCAQAPAPTAPGKFTTAGTFRLVANAYPKTSGECGGLNDFADVKDGLTVRVADQLNTSDVIATGTLTGGHYADQACVWYFTVADIPADHNVYTIMVGQSTAEEVTKDEMQHSVTLTDGRLRS